MVQELPEGTVTVLFTDVVGSTELTNRLGDDRAREVLGACDDLVRGQIERHRGREVKGTGDGLMVAFTSARRAIACAVDIQRAMAERARTDPDSAVGVKIGLNTGEVIREEADLFGATVNAAGRIADHASAGEILLPDAVKGVLGAATTVELEDRGEVELRGFPEPWHLHAVRWEEQASGPAFGERTPYVGRAEERQQLRRLLDEATQGKGALVMIGGEPGVGKTRLSQELGQEARERGVLSLTGHCYEMEGAPPYIPFVEILEAAGRIVPPEAFREALGDAAPEVAKLMPELRRMFPDIPPAMELPPEQERRYLFNSFLEFIERASRGQPLLLVLEDLHWGDDSSLLLLQHIAQQLEQIPVLVVGTYRDVELDVARPLAKALEELLRQRLAHDITLRPLPQADIETMLRARSGQEPPARVVEVIYRETEGNPFFVEEVFKHLVEIGKLFDAEGSWRSDLEIGEEEVPRGVRLVIGRRLERVSEECRGALTAAAIVGRAFSYELLQELVDVEEDALLDAVDEAERVQLVSSAAAGGEARFTFAHEQIRQTLLSGISLPRRQRLHLRVAEAIEKTHSDSEQHAADLAHHLYQAGAAADLSKTVRYLTLAGDQALAAAAFEDALRLYENALSLQPPDDRKGRADLLNKRGSALRSLTRWEEAAADWREALDAYVELGEAEAAGSLSTNLCWQLIWNARFEEGLQIAHRGLSALSEAPGIDRCRLVGLVGMNLSWLGSYAEAEGKIAEALASAEDMGDDRLLGEVLNFKAAHHWIYMEYDRASELALRGAEHSRSAGDSWTLADELWRAQWALLHVGRTDEAGQIAEELEPLAARVGHLGAQLFAGRVRAWRDFMVTGNVGEFEEFAQADLELCLSADDFPWISTAYGFLGVTQLLAGRWEDARKNLEEAARLEPPGFWAGGEWATLFLWNAYAGDKDQALAILDQQRPNLPRRGQPSSLGSQTLLLAAVEGLALLGERQQAAELYGLVLDAVDTGCVTGTYADRLLQTMAGIAAACGEQWTHAEQHYQTALRQAHELPIVIAQPDVRRWYARMLIDRDGPGDRDKARDLLTEAIAMYTKIGMPKHIEMAETMLSEV